MRSESYFFSISYFVFETHSRETAEGETKAYGPHSASYYEAKKTSYTVSTLPTSSLYPHFSVDIR